MEPQIDVSYGRISDDKKDKTVGAGRGVQRQRDDSVEYATRNGFTIGRFFEDNDLSAYSGKPRPAYLEMLELIRAGRIRSVTAYHPDRLHRAPRELEDYIDAVQLHDTQTQFVSAGAYELKTSSGRMQARIRGVIDREASEHASERIKRKQLDMAHRGEYRGGMPGGPFGYDETGVVLNEKEAGLIRKASEDLLMGQSLSAIVREWNESGCLTNRGGLWSLKSVRDVLCRERNYGASIYQGKVVKLDAWPAIIDEATHLSIVALFADPRRKLAESNRGKWLLSGLARCGRCEIDGVVHMVNIGKGPRTKTPHAVYICRPTGHLTRKAIECDALIRGLIVDRLSTPDAHKMLTTQDGVDRPALMIEKRSVQIRLDEAADMYVAGELTRVQLKVASEKLKARLTEIDGQIIDRSSVSPLLAKMISSADPGGAWDRSTWAQQRTVVQSLMTVTLESLGRQAGLPRTFNPNSVRIDWH